MDTIDKNLLDILQKEFPLCVNPWENIALKLDVSEDEILERIKIMKRNGVIRQISPIFNSSKIGYHSTLCAFKVPDNRIESVTDVLVKQSGISHCYLRENTYNIWFTLTLEKKYGLHEELSDLANITCINSWLDLPALKVFKIFFTLNMNRYSKKTVSKVIKKDKLFPDEKELIIDKDFIREIQYDLSLRHNPFKSVAEKLNCSQQDIVDNLKKYIKTGQIRRIAAILRPLRAGYSVNMLVAWKPQKNSIETLGMYAASLNNVSHCYMREIKPQWPYSIYTMIHGEDESTCRNIISDIKENTMISEYCVLKTCKEFKKVRVIYYP